MSIKTRVATTPIAGVRPLAYQAVQATSCHAQLATLLEEQLGSVYAAFLAEPQSNVHASEIDWYTPATGESVKLLDLSFEKQAVAVRKIEQMAARILAFAKTLKEAGDSNSLMAGSLLELALSYPSQDCLYLIGDQPVIVLWGYAQAGETANPELLTRLSHTKLVPSMQSEETTTEVKVSENVKSDSHDKIPYSMQEKMIEEPIRQEKKCWWWEWLPPFLAGLFGCGLLLMLLTWVGNSHIHFFPSSCSRSKTMQEARVPLKENNTPQNKVLAALFAKTSDLQAELARLRAEYAIKRNECPKVPEKPLSEPAPPFFPLEEPEPPLKGPDPLPAEETSPPVIDEELPKKKEVPPPPLPAKEPQKPKKKLGDKLAIPDTAKKNKDLSFLEGCWLADTGKGVVNAVTGLPVAVKFCFDNKGRGTTYVQEHDRKNRLIRECKGSSRAVFSNDGTLIIDDGGSVTCPDGRTYLPERVHCRDNGGEAICSETLRRKWSSVPFVKTNR